MIPFFTFSRRSGKTRLAELLELEARRSKHSAEYAALMESARAQQLRQEWRDFARRFGPPLPFTTIFVPADLADHAATGWALAERNIAKYGYCPACPFPSTPPSMSTYKISRTFTDETELAIFEQACRLSGFKFITQPSSPGAHRDVYIPDFNPANIGDLERKFRELLALAEQNRRVRNTPPERADDHATTAHAAVSPQEFGAGERKKNRCYESITQVSVKGPHSGERYTVRVWRNLAALEINEDAAINRWASCLNAKIDAMSSGGRKVIVNVAWVIHQLEAYMGEQECKHDVVAIEVKDKDGAGKLLYPDWS